MTQTKIQSAKWLCVDSICLICKENLNFFQVKIFKRDAHQSDQVDLKTSTDPDSFC